MALLPAALEWQASRRTRPVASPLARRLAAEAGSDLTTIRGSGPGGRIVKADVLAAVVDVRRAGETRQVPSQTCVSADCAIDAIFDLRAVLNARLGSEVLAVEDFVIRASALAMMRVPTANVSWSGGARRQSADVAFAVECGDRFVAPVIRQADRRGLAEIAAERSRLAAGAELGTLSAGAFEGAHFTVIDLSPHGLHQGQALIDPSCACVLTLGAADRKAVVREGALAVVTMMTCALSADQSVLDGLAAARFLSAFKRFMEAPVEMLL